jgi:hypothetical protein
MDSQASEPPENDASTDAADWRPYASVVRLATGAAGIGLDRLRQIESSIESTDGSAADTPEITFDWQTAGALLVGFVVDLPDRIERGGQSAATMASTARTLTAPVWWFSSAVGLTTLANRIAAPVRASMEAELEHLVSLGADEVARGRRLAGAAFDHSMDSIIDHVAESESLDELVREQTTGITAGAVREVRETGAAADGLTENVLRKLFRRPLREAPEPTLGTE